MKKLETEIRADSDFLIRPESIWHGESLAVTLWEGWQARIRGCRRSYKPEFAAAAAPTSASPIPEKSKFCLYASGSLSFRLPDVHRIHLAW